MADRKEREGDPPPGEEVPDTAFEGETSPTRLTENVPKKEDRLQPQGSPDEDDRPTTG